MHTGKLKEEATLQECKNKKESHHMFNISHATYNLSYGRRVTVGKDDQKLGTVKQCREKIAL